MPESLVEVDSTDTVDHLLERILAGEVFVLKGALQRLGLFDPMVQCSLDGIRDGVGDDIAERVAEKGFERIHEVVQADQIPRVTDAVYKQVGRLTQDFLGRCVPRVFRYEGVYYYERQPNVRFHIPFDLTVSHRKKYDEFAKRYGQGKIAAHGPHRDYWLDCPDNAVNIWIAIGPVEEGNGLSIFTENYAHELSFLEGGELSPDTPLRPPLNFNMQPGDALLFHANHLHASEVNRTDKTRYVVSFRMTFGKPHFPEGHHHTYLHSGLASRGWQRLAAIPAYLQTSYLADRAKRVVNKLTGNGHSDKPSPSAARAKDAKLTAKGEVSLALEDLPVGSIQAIASDACVARLTEEKVVAFSRWCPHKGADLSCGFLRDDELVCSWHNLTFDPETGSNPCQRLNNLRQFPCEVRDDHVIVTAPNAKTSVA